MRHPDLRIEVDCIDQLDVREFVYPADRCKVLPHPALETRLVGVITARRLPAAQVRSGCIIGADRRLQSVNFRISGDGCLRLLAFLRRFAFDTSAQKVACAIYQPPDD